MYLIEIYEKRGLIQLIEYEPIYDPDLKAYWAEFVCSCKADDIRITTEDDVIGRLMGKRTLSGLNKIVIPKFKGQGGFI